MSLAQGDAFKTVALGNCVAAMLYIQCVHTLFDANTMKSPASRVINLRAPAANQALIDQAAEALGKNRTEFILEASCEKAREVLADRTQFALDPKSLQRFNALIEAPPADALRRLLGSRSPWER